jgi:hypothetical protein
MSGCSRWSLRLPLPYAIRKPGQAMVAVATCARKRRTAALAPPASGREDTMALATLVQGSTGPEVRNLQRALNYHLPEELPALNVDGIFGPKTQARLVKFQRAYDLKADAIVGPKTQQALYSFVVLTHYLLPRTYAAYAPVRSLAMVGDGPLPPMPPLPQLRMPPFPTMRLPIPRGIASSPLFQSIPQLKLDPQFELWLRTRPFEVEVGTSMVFRKPTQEDKPGGEVSIEATARVWSAPILSDKVKASGVLGFAGETRVTDGHTETSLFVAARVEVENLATKGPVDILHLQVEGALKKGLDQKPVDMTATIEAGPSIETKDKRFQFNAGGYLELKTNGDEHAVSGGVFIKGAVRF